MSTLHEHHKLIVRYLDGELSPEEVASLNHLLSKDGQVRKDFKTTKLELEVIKTYGFRKMIEDIQRELYPGDVESSGPL